MLRSRVVACTLFCGAAAVAAAAVRPVAVPQGIPSTDQHQWILQGVGEWEGTLQMLMPGMPSEPTPATEKVEALGNLWTQSHFECSFMGMPFAGNACLGYDPAKQKFVGTWIDNMTPSLVVMEGEKDPESGALVMHWEALDMASGQMAPHRSEQLVTQDAYTTTFFVGEGESAVKTMVISMKRKAADKKDMKDVQGE